MGTQGDGDGLAGRVAIVTGSASGIGEGVVRTLARRGARVVVADIDIEGANRVAADIEADGGSALALSVDVGEPVQIIRMVDEVLAAFGQIDVLHNNAVGGSPLDSDVLHMDIEAWDRAMAVNLRGYMLGCQAVLPTMLAQGRGSIVNTSSNSALGGDLTRTAYGVSKAGINALTMYVATQYGRAGVRCNAVSPGVVLTPRMASGDALPQAARDIYQRTHLSPRFALPQDIAHLVAFLASDDSEMINGQILCIDGGMLAHHPAYSEFIREAGG